jgi:hypothetical protein
VSFQTFLGLADKRFGPLLVDDELTGRTPVAEIKSKTSNESEAEGPVAAADSESSKLSAASSTTRELRQWMKSGSMARQVTYDPRMLCIENGIDTALHLCSKW